MKFDYLQHYQNQRGSGLPTYQGTRYQTGYGLGSMFKSFYSWILPMMKTHAVPLLKSASQTLGEEAVKTAANIATDAIHGKDLKTVAKKRFGEAVDSLTRKARHRFHASKGYEPLTDDEQIGNGYKKKRLVSKKITLSKTKKKHKDIFG